MSNMFGKLIISGTQPSTGQPLFIVVPEIKFSYVGFLLPLVVCNAHRIAFFAFIIGIALLASLIIRKLIYYGFNFALGV